MENLGSIALCPHITLTEQGICEDCGMQVSIPDPADDIIAIIRAITETDAEIKRIIAMNTDPVTHQPKLRLIGGQFMRIDHKILAKAVILTGYDDAKAAGYKGDYKRWEETFEESLKL